MQQPFWISSFTMVSLEFTHIQPHTNQLYSRKSSRRDCSFVRRSQCETRPHKRVQPSHCPTRRAPSKTRPSPWQFGTTPQGRCHLSLRSRGVRSSADFTGRKDCSSQQSLFTYGPLRQTPGHQDPRFTSRRSLSCRQQYAHSASSICREFSSSTLPVCDRQYIHVQRFTT
jgi:hypothetical protein